MKNGPILRTRFRAQNRDHAGPFPFVLLKGTEIRSQFWDRNMVPKLRPFFATGGNKKGPGNGPVFCIDFLGDLLLNMERLESGSRGAAPFRRQLLRPTHVAAPIKSKGRAQ